MSFLDIADLPTLRLRTPAVKTLGALDCRLGFSAVEFYGKDYNFRSPDTRK